MTAKAARNERKGFLAGRVSRLVGCLAGQQDIAILGVRHRYQKCQRPVIKLWIELMNPLKALTHRQRTATMHLAPAATGAAHG
jgi:hypothetical protein